MEVYDIDFLIVPPASRGQKSVLCPPIMKNIPILCKITEEFAEIPLGNEKGKCLPANPNDEHQFSFCLHIKTTFQLCFPLQPDQISFLKNKRFSLLRKTFKYINHGLD
jgi:hypothetical protein